MKKTISTILLFILLFQVTFVFSSYDKKYMINPFYAISSSGEYDEVKEILNENNKHIYFQWGRIARNSSGNMQFTNSFRIPLVDYNKYDKKYDLYTEYGLPLTIKMDDYKDRFNNKKAFLSIFFTTTKYDDGRNSIIEFLNMSEEDWKKDIILPIENMVYNIDNKSKYQFDGILLDFEGFRDNYLNESNLKIYTKEQLINMKEKYNNFLKLLKDSINEKELIVLVPVSNVAGYYDGYDYKFINDISNYVILMAYGFEHMNDYIVTISGTQPYNQVNKAVKNIIDSGIENDKLILGLDLSATKWIKIKDTNSNGTYTYRYKKENSYLSGVENMIGEEIYLEDIKTYKKIVTGENILQKDKDKYEDEDSVIESVEYFYEGEETLNNKYKEIVLNYDLAGLSTWRLGSGSLNAYNTLFSMFNSVEKKIYKELPQKNDVDIDKEWTITFNKPILIDSVNNNNIYIKDENNNNIDLKLYLCSNELEVKVLPINKYEYGKKYTLYIEDKIVSKNNIKMSQPLKMEFIMKSK